MKSRLNPVLVTDIFGHTPALAQLADQLASDHVQPVIVDPYSGTHMDFSTQADAYSCFQKYVGLDSYKFILSEKIKKIDTPLFFIGFSVGAAAIWLLSCEQNLQGRAICFYGSQIRHYSAGSPGLKVECMFPDFEPHFDVQSLIQTLSNKKNITCTTVPFSHGFMNQHSPNYNIQACKKYIAMLKQQLDEYASA